MRVLTYRSGGKWLAEQNPTSVDDSVRKLDDALVEIERCLSDSFRCNNLVVLTGLGTSLHVNVDPAVAKRTPLKEKKLAPTMVDLWRAVKAKAGDDFDKVLLLSRFPKNGENVETLLSYCKVAETFVSDDEGKKLITDFITNAEQTVRDLVRFLSEEDDVALHSDLLRRLVRRSQRKVRAKIFTTNYDLCFEYAARQGRYVVIDGFSHTTPQIFDSLYFTYDIVKRESNPDSHDFISNVVQLYKLHGSVDWTRNDKTHEIEKKPDTTNPLLIYPRNTKYELAFEQPYLEMMAALQTALRQPDTGLIVLGFGFNDNHIAEPILAAIRSNLNLKVTVVDPALGPWQDPKGKEQSGSDENNAHIRKIKYLIEQGDARLALISSKFQDIVPLMPDIAAQTDLEQHLERIRLLRGQDK